MVDSLGTGRPRLFALGSFLRPKVRLGSQRDQLACMLSAPQIALLDLPEQGMLSEGFVGYLATTRWLVGVTDVETSGPYVLGICWV